MLMFPEGGFLTLTYRSRASRFSERELNTHLLVAFEPPMRRYIKLKHICSEVQVISMTN